MDIEDRIIEQLFRETELRNLTNAMNVKAEQAEKQHYTYRLQRYALVVGLSLAVCLTIVLFIVPWGNNTISSQISQINIDRPTLAEYRAASSSSVAIDEAMAYEDYESALLLIDNGLFASSQTLNQFSSMQEIEDETLLYEKELEMSYHYQLQWMRIYVLVSLGRKDEAIDELLLFLPDNGEHQKEAESLFETLRNN